MLPSIHKGRNGQTRSSPELNVLEGGANSRWNRLECVDDKTGEILPRKELTFLRSPPVSPGNHQHQHDLSGLEADTGTTRAAAHNQTEDELLKVIVSVQDLTHWFQELSEKLDGRHVQLGRVLGKIRVRYVNCFEKLLKVLSQDHALRKHHMMERMEEKDETIQQLERDLSEAKTENKVLQARCNAQGLVSITQTDRIEELERDVDYLRSMLRNEKEDLIAKTRPQLLQDPQNGALVPISSETVDQKQEQQEVDPMERPLNIFDQIVRSFEEKELHTELVLSHMGRLLEAAQYQAKRKMANDAVYMAAKLRKDCTLVEVCERGTMTSEKVTGFGSGSNDIMEVSGPTTLQTLWWKAFNFARCPRCSIEVGEEVSAVQLQHLQNAKQKAQMQKWRVQMEKDIRQQLQKEFTRKKKKKKNGMDNQQTTNAKPSSKNGGGQGSSDEDEDDSENEETQNPEENPETNNGNSHIKDIQGHDGRSASRRQSEVANAMSPVVIAKVMRNVKTGFKLPEAAGEFLVNIPMELSQAPAQSVEWLLARISGIYNAKVEADKADLIDGMPLQPLCEFVIEHLLYEHGLRRLAEVRLFELLSATRLHLKKHPRIRLFARFVDAIQVINEDDRLDNLQLLQTFLEVRKRLLSPFIIPDHSHYQGRDEEVVDDLDEHGKMLMLEEEDQQTLPIINHGRNSYVPIDHAVKIMQMTYAKFLPPRKVNINCKLIESMAAVHVEYVNNKGQMIQDVREQKGTMVGDRMTVRMNMRNAMLNKTSKKEKTTDEPKKDEKQQKQQVVVDIDKVLESLVSVLLLRQKHIQEKLKQLFIQGDADGDGVLSFEEFQEIVQKANPMFSQRKILRMFKDALRSNRVKNGNNRNSLSLSPQTFTKICTQYNVLNLI